MADDNSDAVLDSPSGSAGEYAGVHRLFSEPSPVVAGRLPGDAVHSAPQGDRPSPSVLSAVAGPAREDTTRLAPPGVPGVSLLSATVAQTPTTTTGPEVRAAVGTPEEFAEFRAWQALKKEQLERKSTCASTLSPAMCTALGLATRPQTGSSPGTHQVAPTPEVARSLPSSAESFVRSDANAPAEHSLGERRDGGEEPMDCEPTVSRARSVPDSESVSSLPVPPAPSRETTTRQVVTAAAPSGAVASTSRAADTSAVKSAGEPKVSFACQDYRYYHSDGTRREHPVGVDTPPPQRVEKGKPASVSGSSQATSREGSRPPSSSSGEWCGRQARRYMAYLRDNSYAEHLGFAPQEDTLEQSLWFVRAPGGGSVKLAKFLEGNVAGLTETSLQRLWEDPAAGPRCFEDYCYGDRSGYSLALPEFPVGEWQVSDDEGWCAPRDEPTVPLKWYTDLCAGIMRGEQSGSLGDYTRQEVACLKYVRRVFRPEQACLFCDAVRPSRKVARAKLKRFLRWANLARHICEEHLHTAPLWRCVRPFNVSDANAACPVMRKTGQYFACKRRGEMMRHLRLQHGRTHSDLIQGLHDLQFHPERGSKRAVAFTNKRRSDFVFGRETLVLQKQHRLIALYLFDPASRELRRERYMFGRGASSARRGRGRGRGGAMTRSKSADGGAKTAAGKQVAKPGKGKSGSSLEPMRDGSRIDLGRNIGSDRSESPPPPPPTPPKGGSSSAVAWPALPKRADSGERSSSRASRRRKRQKTAVEPTTPTPTMSEVVARETASGLPVVVSSVQAQMTPLGQVPRRRVAAAAGSAAQLEESLRASRLEAYTSAPEPCSSVPAAVGSDAVVPSSVAIADETTVVELKSIVGRLCAANRSETVLRIKNAVDGLVSAFVDGFDAVAAQTSAAAARRAEGQRGEDYKALQEKVELCERKLEASREQRAVLQQRLGDAEMTFSSAFRTDLCSWDGSMSSLDLSRFPLRERLHDMPAGVVQAAEQQYEALLGRASRVEAAREADTHRGDGEGQQ